MNYIISALAGIGMSVATAFAALHGQPQQLTPQMQDLIHQYVEESISTPNFGGTSPIAGQTYNLAGSGLSQTSSSITLAQFKVTQTGQPILDSDLGDIFYITLEPGNPAKQEIVSCTTDTQNANGTATFSGCVRGLSPIPPYTASSTLQFSHGGGTQVIFSNPPQFYNEYAALANNNTFTGVQVFPSSDPSRAGIASDVDTSVNTAFVTFGQLSRQAIAGAANASETVKGIIQLATGVQVASSTSSGSTGARLVIPASLATSSPGSNFTLGVPITSNDGKLSALFFNGTAENYTYNGTSTFNQGFIVNASSTFSTSTHLASVTSSILKTDSTGQITAGIPGVDYESATKYVFATTTSTKITGGSTEQYQKSSFFTIPSGVLQASSTISVTVFGTQSVGGNNAGAACDVGVLANNIGVATNTPIVSGTSVTNNTPGWVTFNIIDNGSLSSQLLSTIGAQSSQSNTTPTNNSGPVASLSTSAVNLSGTVTIALNFSASANSSGTNPTCTYGGYTISVNP